MTLSWVASTDPVAGYNIYRSGASGGPYVRLNSPLIDATTFVDSTALAGQTYYYVATAVDSAGNESYPSNQVEVDLP